MEKQEKAGGEPLERWMRPAEAAERIGVSEWVLMRWRSQGTGPRWSKLSHRIVVYAYSDVLAWIEARANRPKPVEAA